MLYVLLLSIFLHHLACHARCSVNSAVFFRDVVLKDRARLHGAVVAEFELQCTDGEVVSEKGFAIAASLEQEGLFGLEVIMLLIECLEFKVMECGIRFIRKERNMVCVYILAHVIWYELIRWLSVWARRGDYVQHRHSV